MHLTNSWHENSGGIATFYRSLVEEANLRRQQIRLVVPGASDRIEEVGEFGRIYHVKAPPSPLNRDYRTIYPSQFLFRGSKLREILNAERPDLVEISDKYTLHYLGALLRLRLLDGIAFRPVVVGLSQERMDDNFSAYLGEVPFGRKFSPFYMKWFYFPFFDHHIANSEYTASELRAAAQGHLLPRGTWVRPMGVDLTCLSPQRRSAELRRRLLQNFGAPEESVLLFYAGRLVPEKNLGLLFKTLGHLSKSSGRDYRLQVAGDGIERTQWEQKCAQELPSRVLFLGHIRDRNVLAGLYANSDVFVHPNPREPFGIAPLEAMASGLPLVVPNTGGVASYANAENAWIAEPDPESFATVIEEAVVDRQLATEKTAKALAMAQLHGWKQVASSFLDLYSELGQQTGTQNGAVAAPAFYSTPAARSRAFLMHWVSQFAAKSFRLASRLGSQPPPQRCPRIVANSTGSTSTSTG